MTNSPPEIATDLTAIALEAGAAILPLFRAGLAVESKADASPVTEADRRAEEIILSRLAAAMPGVPVLAEEAAASGDKPNVGANAGEEFLLVDPLDGTREFIGGSGEFTVNIALVRGGAPIAGVVYAPALGEMFAGVAGHGAFAARADGELPTAWRRIETRKPAPAALTAVASRSHGSTATDAFLARLNVGEYVKAGSSLKFCRVAEGAADIYPRFGRTMEWDTGAGQAVLEAAGGIVLEAPDEPGHAPPITRLGYGKSARGFDTPHFIAWGDPAFATRA